MSTTADICVNIRVGKHSHLLLRDPSGPFSATTTVDSVKDSAHNFEWEPTAKWKGNPTRLPIKLKCTKGKTTDDRADDKSVKDDVVESGTLTITLTNGPPSPVYADVAYVNDGTA